LYVSSTDYKTISIKVSSSKLLNIAFGCTLGVLHKYIKREMPCSGIMKTIT